MPALQLSACLSRNPMTAPILAGEVKPQGVEWAVSGIHPSEMFWRQLKFGDFDVSEMSLASLSIAVSQGQQDWVAIPVFTTRRFFHTGIMVREGAGIQTPKDLVGKRVGVPEYQQTAALWTRGALQHEFGVSPQDMTWFMERPPERSHGGSTAFSPPPGVDLSYIPPSTTMGQMLARGELDAAIVYISDKNLVDRTREDADSVPLLRPLFPDPIAEGIRYYETTGLLPVNHTVVIRAALLEKHPWLALNVYSAFVAAKEAVLRPLLSPPSAKPQPLGHGGALDPFVQVGVLPPAVAAQMTATDPLPYGVQGQSKVFDALSAYLLEQGLVRNQFAVEQLFAESTLDL
jgi:4,5-dihydroxyphthalate decarboxylase